MPLFDQIILLRHKLARHLCTENWNSHLQYKLQVCYKTESTVRSFIDLLRECVLDKLPAEIDKLLQLKNADLADRNLPSEDVIQAYNVPYYCHIY